MPPLLLGILLLAGLLIVAAALGRRLLRALHVAASDPMEHAVFAVGLGMGALQIVPFLLLACGIARPLVFRVALILLICGLWPDLRAVVRGAIRWLRGKHGRFEGPASPWGNRITRALTRREHPRWQPFLIGVFVTLFVAVGLRAMCPITDDDGLSYHLAAAVRLLDAGRFAYLPTLTYTNWPMGVESLFVLLRALHPDAPVGLVQFAFGATIVAAGYLYGRRLGGALMGAGATSLLLVYKVFWEEMTQGHVDLGMTAFATLSVFALAHAATPEESQSPSALSTLPSRGRGRGDHIPADALHSALSTQHPALHPAWLRLSALFAGLAATTKLNGLWVIAAMAVVVLLTDWPVATPAEQPIGQQPPPSPPGMKIGAEKHGYLFSLSSHWLVGAAVQHSLRLRVSAIQLCFQTGLPSALRSALQYAVIALCVVVPWTIRTWVLTGNPVYPMLYNLFGGREWTAEGWPRLQFAFLLYTSLPGLEPVRANLLLARALLVGAALLLAVWVFRATRGSPLALPARFAAVVSPLLLLGSGYNLRFLLPAYPCVALCAASVFRGRDKRLAPVVCLLALLLAVRVGGSGLKPDLRTAVSVALGQTSREEYLQGVLTDYRVVEFANRNLPSDARILVGTWEEDTAYYRASTLRANYWLQDSVHYDSPARLEADLNRLDVQYLVYKPMEAAWCLRSYICRGRMETETRALGDLARRRGTKLFESNGVALFHLDLR